MLSPYEKVYDRTIADTVFCSIPVILGRSWAMRSTHRGTRTYYSSIRAGQFGVPPGTATISFLINGDDSTIPKDIRRSATEGFRMRRLAESDPGHEFGEDFTATSTASNPEHAQSDEEVDAKGWVRKKVDKVKHKGGGSKAQKPEWETKPVKALNAFRVNLGALRRVQGMDIRSNGSVLTRVCRNSQQESRIPDLAVHRWTVDDGRRA